MKFKGKKDFRYLDHTDKDGDQLQVTVCDASQWPVLISAFSRGYGACVGLTVKQARSLIRKLEKELG
jgi:hypothetical protein